jgi:hypothetical protein
VAGNEKKNVATELLNLKNDKLLVHFRVFLCDSVAKNFAQERRSSAMLHCEVNSTMWSA